ncbi:acyl transferase/acyl hydrolase/lysophospholipase [Chytridium lagenaria]|nr:acyl transferase/acyl hydrolase/lysophospholipase [Chytridium lagenaria]
MSSPPLPPIPLEVPEPDTMSLTPPEIPSRPSSPSPSRRDSFLRRKPTLGARIASLAFEDDETVAVPTVEIWETETASASGSTLLTTTQTKSESGSIRSTASALSSNEAVMTGFVNTVVTQTHKIMGTLLPKVSKNVDVGLQDSLEVMAAFEVLPKEMKRRHLDGIRNPEIFKVAAVSQDNLIPDSELQYQQDRRRFGRISFARFINVPEELVDEADVPHIAVGGSGGGLKAMIGTTGFLKAMEDEGLYDAVMYLAGVSGSCWTLSNLYRTATQCSPTRLADLLVKTLENFPGDPLYLQETLLPAPLHRVPLLFGGLVSKRLQNLPRGVVELYSSFMQTHFFSTDVDWEKDDFTLSKQWRFCEDGRGPCPIYTAIRHERPWKARRGEEVAVFGREEMEGMEKWRREVEERRAWWQWFELTPLQVGCDELKVWIPSWSFGRRFKGGISTDQAPEQNFTMIVGMVASAMTAPFQTSCETLERTHPTSWVGSMVRNHAVKMLAPDASTRVKEMLSLHPFHAAYNWNPLYRITQGPHPPGLINSERIQLIDAGADNNQPLYPFLRKGRNVDVIFVLDSSEDVERNMWALQKILKILGKRRGLVFTRTSPEPANPADFDEEEEEEDEVEKDTDGKSETGKESAPATPQLEPNTLKDKPTIFTRLSHSISSSSLASLASTTSSKKPKPLAKKKKVPYAVKYANRYCQIFKGVPVHPPGAVGDHGEPMAEREVMLIYLPTIGNDGMEEGFSPSAFSFGKLQYKKKETADLLKCAEFDFMQDVDRIRDALRAVWEAKRDARLAAASSS